MSAMNTTICTMSVRLIFTVFSYLNRAQRRTTRALVTCAERSEERIGESEEQRKPDSDHRHCIK
jgi:hypothetical protein